MPELPEIETIRTGLSQYIIGQKIKRVTIYSPKLRYPIDLISSKIHPATLCYQLNQENIAALVYAIKQTLRAAIKSRRNNIKKF